HNFRSKINKRPMLDTQMETSILGLKTDEASPDTNGDSKLSRHLLLPPLKKQASLVGKEPTVKKRGGRLNGRLNTVKVLPSSSWNLPKFTPSVRERSEFMVDEKMSESVATIPSILKKPGQNDKK